MSDKINKLHRYMRIGINRTGSFPSQPELMKKLGINPKEFNELIIFSCLGLLSTQATNFSGTVFLASARDFIFFSTEKSNL